MLVIGISFYWVVRGLLLPYLPSQATEILLYRPGVLYKRVSVLASISTFVSLFGVIGILWYETGKED